MEVRCRVRLRRGAAVVDVIGVEDNSVSTEPARGRLPTATRSFAAHMYARASTWTRRLFSPRSRACGPWPASMTMTRGPLPRDVAVSANSPGGRAHLDLVAVGALDGVAYDRHLHASMPGLRRRQRGTRFLESGRRRYLRFIQLGPRGLDGDRDLDSRAVVRWCGGKGELAADGWPPLVVGVHGPWWPGGRYRCGLA